MPLNRLKAADLRFKLFQQRQKRLIVFVVDASDSMGEGTLERMKAAKGAVLGWLLSAYQQRDQVALIAFRGHRADLLLPPTGSVLSARRHLRQLAVGGATPFAAGLDRAWQLVRVARQKQTRIQPLVVVLSDGEANVPLSPGVAVIPELMVLGERFKRENIPALVVDSGNSAKAAKTMRNLAAAMGGSYRKVRDLHAGRLFEMIRKVDEA